MNTKLRVAVIAGGKTPEHDISLLSAAYVLNTLDRRHFDPLLIQINKDGRWLLNDAQDLVSLDEIKNLCDVAFPIVHGRFGEDGILQGLFELLEIPYVGASVLSSAVCMDKVTAKRLIASEGVAVVPYFAFNQGQWKNQFKYDVASMSQQLGYPVFVKSSASGSSIGITKVVTEDALHAAVEEAFLYDSKVIVEKAVCAREIELSVLENESYGLEPLVSLPGEIIPTHEFYSYEAKYLDQHGADLRIPAALTADQIQEVQKLAQRIFMALDCEGMARIDFFLDKETGQFYFNEANTLPGFTKISMYPKLWEISGILPQDLLARLVRLAVSRHQRKSRLKKEFFSEIR